MKCSNCGAEIRDGAAFCPKCGERQAAQPMQDVQMGQSTQPAQTEQFKLSGGIIAGISVAVLTVVAVIVAVIFLQKGALPTGGETDLADNKGADSAVDESPLYAIGDVAVIDLSARDYTPGTKEPGMKWDSELFYWLEDADTLTEEDGNIANCNVSKMLLRDARTGGLRQYEIYSDPDDGSVYKIVSVSSDGSVLQLVDYYYKDGQPNFMFKREDTVYTPTYATIGKVGERYYFDSDVMVRWRMIRVPGEIGEYTLNKGDVWYSQADYFAESDEIQEIYDETEYNVLNEAHNVYDTVTKSVNIGIVQGCLRDTAGNGVAGKKIKLYRAEDNVLLYETGTDEDGSFSFFVYLDGTVCSLVVDGDKEYREIKLQGVALSPSSAIYAYDLTAHKESGDKYPVTIRLYSVADMVSDEDGDMNADALRQVTAVVREGGRNYSGEVLEEAETSNGKLVLNLPAGIYTVQLQAEGYPGTYLEVEVPEGETSKDAYLMPKLAESQTGVILTWEGEGVDLDLTLFTPYQGADGDMAHIGGTVKEDGHGNFLISDNNSRCEAMYLNTGAKGSYKLYVNNYTDSMAGNYSSSSLSASNVHIYVYNSNGFVADYTLVSGQNGVVWEVAEISGSAITPAQRVYAEIGGKSWWMEDKGKKAVIRTETTTWESRDYVGTQYTEYDEQGNMLTWTSLQRLIESRDADGTVRYAGGEGRHTTDFENVYDEYGNLTEQTAYSDGIPEVKTFYEYTYVNGRISESDEYTLEWDGSEWGAWGVYGTVITCTYDEKGRILTWRNDMRADYYFYNETEEYITQFINENLFVGRESEQQGYLLICDENGVLLRKEWYEGSSYVNIRRVEEQYSYDANGNCISLRVAYGEEMSDMGEDWYYDKYNRLIQHDGNYGTGASIYTDTYTYNSSGQLESKHTELDNNFHTDKDSYYYYDERGNLIRSESISYYDESEYGPGDSGTTWYNGSRWIESMSRTEYTYY